jgi:hypothetical protein
MISSEKTYNDRRKILTISLQEHNEPLTTQNFIQAQKAKEIVDTTLTPSIEPSQDFVENVQIETARLVFNNNDENNSKPCL